MTNIDQLHSTGIEGLDEILGGGLPRDCFFLVQGDPGAGKTTLALQFLLEGVRRGEPTLYVTLSETKKELERVARSHHWSLEGIRLLEMSAIEAFLRPEAQTTVFHPSEIELAKVTEALLDEVHKIKPKRAVFDSLSEYRLTAESPLRYRRALLNLKKEFSQYDTTLLLLDDKMDNQRIGSDPHVLSVAHGVLELEHLSPDYGVSRRRLQALKMRGVKFREGYHDYIIVTGGLQIFPRLVAAEHHTEFERTAVSSGIRELDALFGGGLERGTTTLILGQAGTGKSTLAVHFAARLASQKERAMMFIFDETRGVLMSRARQLGLDLEPCVKSSALSVQQVDPAELSPGEFASRIIRGVKAGCKLVVIDSLNGYLNAMPGERYLNNQLHELCSFLDQQGVVTILVLAQQGLLAAAEAPVELSYLADTLVNIRYFEAIGEVRQAISVLKRRVGPHEKTIREFRLEPGKGIRIGPPLNDFQGVLAGVPVFRGSAQKMLRGQHARR